jgi:hypothetical protein
MPTLCVSQSAAIFMNSVMPPVLGRGTETSTTTLKPCARPVFAETAIDA